MVLTLNNKSPDVEVLAQIAEESPQVGEVMETVTFAQVLAHAREDDPALLIIQAEPDSQETLTFLQDLLTVNPVIRVLVVSRQPFPPTAPMARLVRVHLLKAPFNRSGAATLMQWLLDPADRNGGSLYRAELRDLRLLDVLQMKAHNGANCCLRIVADNGATGTLHFFGGRLIHAATRNLTGKDAFHDICLFGSGSIAELPFDAACPTSMVTATHEMIMDAARFMDERLAQGPMSSKARTATAPIPMTGREDDLKKVDELKEEELQGIPKLLVIDDSPEVLLALQQTLVVGLRDYAIITSSSAASGLEWAVKFRPDLIVLDYFMPGMNGDVFCERLWLAEGCDAIPIILISGQEAVLEEMERKEPTRIGGTLRKPFEGQALVELSRRLLGVER